MGVVVGSPVGTSVEGGKVGGRVGGGAVGLLDVGLLGAAELSAVGCGEGGMVGSLVGSAVVGVALGLNVGFMVGSLVGNLVLGAKVGGGPLVGALLVGDRVTSFSSHPAHASIIMAEFSHLPEDSTAVPSVIEDLE